MDHRPSIIAAASLLASSDAHMTREQVELNLKAIPSFGSLEYVSSTALRWFIVHKSDPMCMFLLILFLHC